MARQKMTVFMPTGFEYERRLEASRWMILNGWDADVIDDVLHRDSPDIEGMVRLVYRYGPDEAHRRIQRFNEE